MSSEPVPLKVLVCPGSAEHDASWMFFIPNREIFTSKTDAGYFPRIKFQNGQWIYKNLLPRPGEVSEKYQAFTIATFDPKWRDQIVSGLEKVSIPKAEQIAMMEHQAREWHTAQVAKQDKRGRASRPPDLHSIAMPEVPGLKEFESMLQDPAMRTRAWVNEGISHLAMWTLPGPDGQPLPSPVRWEWKGIRALSTQTFLPPALSVLEEFDEYKRTLVVQKNATGRNMFFYRGQEWTEVRGEIATCMSCIERDQGQFSAKGYSPVDKSRDANIQHPDVYGNQLLQHEEHAPEYLHRDNRSGQGGRDDHRDTGAAHVRQSDSMDDNQNYDSSPQALTRQGLPNDYRRTGDPMAAQHRQEIDIPDYAASRAGEARQVGHPRDRREPAPYMPDTRYNGHEDRHLPDMRSRSPPRRDTNSRNYEPHGQGRYIDDFDDTIDENMQSPEVDSEHANAQNTYHQQNRSQPSITKERQGRPPGRSYLSPIIEQTPIPSPGVAYRELMTNMQKYGIESPDSIRDYESRRVIADQPQSSFQNPPRNKLSGLRDELRATLSGDDDDYDDDHSFSSHTARGADAYQVMTRGEPGPATAAERSKADQNLSRALHDRLTQVNQQRSQIQQEMDAPHHSDHDMSQPLPRSGAREASYDDILDDYADSPTQAQTTFSRPREADANMDNHFGRQPVHSRGRSESSIEPYSTQDHSEALGHKRWTSGSQASTVYRSPEQAVTPDTREPMQSTSARASSIQNRLSSAVRSGAAGAFDIVPIGSSSENKHDMRKGPGQAQDAFQESYRGHSRTQSLEAKQPTKSMTHPSISQGGPLREGHGQRTDTYGTDASRDESIAQEQHRAYRHREEMERSRYTQDSTGQHNAPDAIHAAPSGSYSNREPRSSNSSRSRQRMQQGIPPDYEPEPSQQQYVQTQDPPTGLQYSDAEPSRTAHPRSRSSSRVKGTAPSAPTYARPTSDTVRRASPSQTGMRNSHGAQEQSPPYRYS